jgi:membrane-associated PAP2 superfamily phosphatase
MHQAEQPVDSHAERTRRPPGNVVDAVRRHAALGFAVALEMLFGFSHQQLRGAHFMSHDVWTAAICWFTALALFVLWPPKQSR